MPFSLIELDQMRFHRINVDVDKEGVITLRPIGSNESLTFDKSDPGGAIAALEALEHNTTETMGYHFDIYQSDKILPDKLKGHQGK